MSKKTKVLLTNAYAVNVGDMALVLALYQALKKKGFDVSIATFYYKFLKEKYPNLPLVRELLDYNLLVGATFVKKIFLKANYLVNRKYKSFDVYVGSPGGYMNSYYGLKKCLLPLEKAKNDDKKTAVYSQSIGPLNERDKGLLNQYSQSIDLILVRDNFSKEVVDSTTVDSDIYQTKDAAFLLEPRVSKAEKSNLVAVSVRPWKHDNRSMDAYYELIESLCNRVLDNGFDIEFISTCQGVEGYVDDSKTAMKIKRNILASRPDVVGRVRVNSSYNTFYELTDYLNTKYAFVIGTRLHMCILSMINGTPAFNISYEVKGKECYNYLGMQEYSVDFNDCKDKSMDKIDAFMNNLHHIKVSLYDKILEVHEESLNDLNCFIEKMELQKTNQVITL
ncbi:polysaccharide pyruvyl transferase family protein [Aestuariibaculum sediminum]|uniref:Polysaccharide pyruvyl transferase family protein n=1 Tax=Aestuariibaculum sediminum TaxID=2770637 RepID=A0A8J6U7I9_9FLAO|nr:polysaccharide pyruvyl transferase family protein [Aestuariibaculum sediminum]MBD0832048.1 polysaccharide pyruvyl transferase family protein [Aestuariibaculum sediminum]